MNDLKRLLEIAQSEGEVDYTASQETNLHPFLDYFGFKAGTTPYNKEVLAALWEAWSGNSDPKMLRKFKQELMRTLPSQRRITVMLDEESFTMEKEELVKLIGQVLFKGRYDIYKKKSKIKKKDSL